MGATGTSVDRVGLAGLLGALSLTTDLAAGVPLETSLRTAVIAGHLAREAGFSLADRHATHYGTLLRHVGCTAWAHEAAAIAAGDDHDLLRTFEGTDTAARGQVVGRALGRLARGASPLARARAVVRALADPGAGTALATAQCDQARLLAGDLGLGDDVCAVLEQIYERWDGAGRLGLAGTSLLPGARALHVAQVLEIHARTAGLDAAFAELRRRAGRHLDPSLVEVAAAGRSLLEVALADDDPWTSFLAAEPDAATTEGLPAVAVAFGRYADLKVPSRIGHSERVAALAAAAGRAAGLDAAEVAALGLAGHLHDLGVVAVPNGVLERAGPLTVGGREALRLHAYHGERILARCPPLAGLAPLVGAHHERLDGRGYHRGVEAAGLGRAARLLAAADVAAGLSRSRPDRPARDADEVAIQLRAEAREGQLCPRAVEAVLGADGHRPLRQAPHPSGLTPREIEVVGHLARGATNKEIAATLRISPRTVQHHLEHVFAKVGATTRAAVALWAARQSLL